MNKIPLKVPIPIPEQKWDEHVVPLVSIVNNTYNHERFIRDALEGFLMQKTTFRVEILVHDDASTDGTAAIVRDYEARYPELIKPVYQTENQFSKGITISTTFQFPRARGKYIALCEGDDYWTDPLKLQKQAEFLEKNEEYVLCFHNFYNNSNGKISQEKSFHPESMDLFDYASHLFGIQTLTVLYRNIPLLANFTNPYVVGSKFLFLALAEYGNLYYIDHPMAVYRRHEGGIWSGASFKSQVEMALGNILAMMLHFNNKSKVKNILFKSFWNKSRHYFIQSIRKNNKNVIWLIFRKLSIAIIIRFSPKYFSGVIKKLNSK